MKICTRCKIKKLLSDYHKDPRHRDGKQSQCKACCNEYGRRRYKEVADKRKQLAKKWRDQFILSNPEEYRRRCRGAQLQRYWPSLAWQQAVEKYEELLKASNYSCRICKKNQSCFKKKLAVDHNHETGKIRSVLCLKCNKLFVGTHTVETARQLYEYLLEFDSED